LALLTEADGFVAMNWEAAGALGVRRSFPFFTREVLELAFECHPTELVGPGTKKLLRTALRDDVPHKNLTRPDKGSGGPSLDHARHAWETPLPEALATVLRREWWPNPPTQLDFGEAFHLSQLLIFAESLGLRRRARDLHSQYPVKEAQHV